MDESSIAAPEPPLKAVLVKLAISEWAYELEQATAAHDSARVAFAEANLEYLYGLRLLAYRAGDWRAHPA